MRHWRIWLYLVAMIAILGSCVLAGIPNGLDFLSAPTPVSQEAVSQNTAPAETVSTASEVHTEAPPATDTQAPEITAAPTGEEAEAPTEAPTQTEVAAVAQVDNCVECHTDKDQLIDTAAPEEEVVEESEGAG